MYQNMYAKFHVGDWSEKSESNQTNEINFHIILQMYWGLERMEGDIE